MYLKAYTHPVRRTTVQIGVDEDQFVSIKYVNSLGEEGEWIIQPHSVHFAPLKHGASAEWIIVALDVRGDQLAVLSMKGIVDWAPFTKSTD